MKKLRWCDYGALVFGVVSGMMVGKYGKAFYGEIFPQKKLRNWDDTCDQLECECDMEDYPW